MHPTRTLIVDLPGPDLGAEDARQLKRLGAGGVCLFARNVTTPDRTARLIRDLRDALGHDALVGVDQEGGAVLRRLDVPLPPTPQALGVLDDPRAAHRAGQIAARGLIELGINWNFAPSLDVNVDPLNPVIGERSFGTDPERVAALGTAWAQGSEAAGVLGCVKHFPGHGDTRVDSHLDLPVVRKAPAELERTEWPPFQAAVRAGVGSLMTAHILYPALDPEAPATLSGPVLSGLLRGQWGYDGVVVTDDVGMRAIADRHPAFSAAPLALQAGADAVLVCGHGDPGAHEQAARALDLALSRAALTEARVAQALARLSRAAARFPGTPRPYLPGQWDADEQDVAWMAEASLTWTAAPLTLDPGREVLLLAPDTAPLGGPYGDALSGEALAAALRAHLPRLHRVSLHDESGVRQALRDPDVPVLLATTGRWAVPEDTRRTAALLGGRRAPVLHLALWSAQAAVDLALPAVITHGFRPANLNALGRALSGVRA
ncbi:beta-N-acetylhexosaminidase [Deinococcus ficus]|uniref:Beta-N-acetylhexosaminidase n=1 Tax=Deinococcus ficus TaxID=317577 RepID=A0A221T0V5_9DEIO|nr:beta-N-acetylhexosaminidase [Deinococcus ficus]ASN82535.1 beta-N-acetylhexosaminidase [Deinococcus ficus]